MSKNRIITINDKWSVEVHRNNDGGRPMFIIGGPGHLSLELYDTSDGTLESFLHDALAVARALATSGAENNLMISVAQEVAQ